MQYLEKVFLLRVLYSGAGLWYRYRRSKWSISYGRNKKAALFKKKLDQKIYYHHSDYVGGMKETTLKEKLAKKPEQVIELAVKGMLPKGPLGRQMYTKLHVYAGPEHNHAAQKPEVLTF